MLQYSSMLQYTSSDRSTFRAHFMKNGNELFEHVSSFNMNCSAQQCKLRLGHGPPQHICDHRETQHRAVNNWARAEAYKPDSQETGSANVAHIGQGTSALYQDLNEGQVTLEWILLSKTLLTQTQLIHTHGSATRVHDPKVLRDTKHDAHSASMSLYPVTAAVKCHPNAATRPRAQPSILMGETKNGN